MSKQKDLFRKIIPEWSEGYKYIRIIDLYYFIVEIYLYLFAYTIFIISLQLLFHLRMYIIIKK